MAWANLTTRGASAKVSAEALPTARAADRLSDAVDFVPGSRSTPSATTGSTNTRTIQLLRTRRTRRPHPVLDLAFDIDVQVRCFPATDGFTVSFRCPGQPGRPSGLRHPRPFRAS